MCCWGIVISSVLITLPLVGRNIDEFFPIINNDFVRGCLLVPVDWPLWLLLPGLFYLLAMLLVVGFVFKGHIGKAVLTLFISTTLVIDVGAVFLPENLSVYLKVPR